MSTDDRDEAMRRLRRRAAQLRAGETLDEAPDDETPDDETPDDETPDDEAPDQVAATDDEPTVPAAAGAAPVSDTAAEPAADEVGATQSAFEMSEGVSRSAIDTVGHDDLLTRWADEEQLESAAPKRNWSNAIAVLVLLVVVGIAFLGGRALLASSADDDALPGGPSGEDAQVGSVLDEDAPTLDDLTSSVTLPPGPDTGLGVADKGVTVVEDRFDAARREGTFAVLVANPHDDWLAQGVQVQVTFLGEGGQPLGTDQGFIEVVLPSQTVAVASLFFDAPTEPVVDLDVKIDVARWRRTEPFTGGFDLTDVVTGPAEFSGVVTDFTITSAFEDRLQDVGITAVYRDATGRIIGGSDTFVDLLAPGVPTPVQIALLANITLEDIAATELYPSAAFGFVPGEDG